MVKFPFRNIICFVFVDEYKVKYKLFQFSPQQPYRYTPKVLKLSPTIRKQYKNHNPEKQSNCPVKPKMLMDKKSL